MDTNKKIISNNTLEVELNLALEKYEDIKQIEKDFRELNQIFKSLNELVNSQSQPIAQIEDMITIAKSKVDKGTHDLVKANEYVISNRLFYTGVIVGGVLSGLATYGLSFGFWATSTIGGSVVGGIIGKNINK